MPGMDTLRFVCTAAGALLALTLTACGENSNDTGDTQSAENVVPASNVQAAELPLEPINLAQAYSPLSGASRPVPVCPWLSDASANAAVDVVMTTEPMVRRAVTPDECKWNVNIGFALSIRSVPLAEAINPSTVTYNMDNAPVLKPQDGPASEAVAILDPTWDAENPRPFAFVFTADNRQFKITTTGVRTSVDRLRAVADEIAGALPTAAPVVEVKDAEPTLNPCVYPENVVVTLFNGQPGDTLTQKPYLPTSSCSYKGHAGNVRIDLSIGFNGDPLVPPVKMDPDYALIGNFGTDAYMKDTSRTSGYGSSSRVYQIANSCANIRLSCISSSTMVSPTICSIPVRYFSIILSPFSSSIC